jgi:hypothetical protein
MASSIYKPGPPQFDSAPDAVPDDQLPSFPSELTRPPTAGDEPVYYGPRPLPRRATFETFDTAAVRIAEDPASRRRQQLTEPSLRRIDIPVVQFATANTVRPAPRRSSLPLLLSIVSLTIAALSVTALLVVTRRGTPEPVVAQAARASIPTSVAAQAPPVEAPQPSVATSAAPSARPKAPAKIRRKAASAKAPSKPARTSR